MEVTFSFSFFSQNVTQCPQITEQVSSDLSRDLAALHDICLTYESELQQLSQSQVTQLALSLAKKNVLVVFVGRICVFRNYNRIYIQSRVLLGCSHTSFCLNLWIVCFFPWCIPCKSIHLKGLCHGSPVHFVLFCQLLALNCYGT